MERDRLGLALSTGAPAAAQAYRDGVELLLSAFPGAEACFERAHVAILDWSIGGDAERALQALLAHVEEFPRDALALSLALGAFGLFAFSGRADHDQARLALCEKLAPSYGEDWWFLTYLGWSYTEAGNLAQGRRVTERALAQRAHNAHAAHAMAHSFEEYREGAAGTAFLQAWLAHYARSGVLYGHLQWHLALWRLAAGDAEGALRIYAEQLAPARHTGPPINVISDGASLLWRLALSGLESSEMQGLADHAAQRYPGRTHHFIEWHLALAGLPRSLEPTGGPHGSVLRAVCAGLAAFGRRDYAGALGLLEPAAGDFVRLGGSGAQRRVIDDTIDAARRLRDG